MMSNNPVLLCHLNDVPDSGSKGFKHNDIDLFCVKEGDQVYAYINQCPHLGLPLEWQADQFLNQDRSLIQCATHGALFEITSGTCIAGPCQGQSLIPIPCFIEDQQVYIEL